MIPSARPLLDVLSNQNVTFFIPPYQRNYEWEEEQCKVFYEDIMKTHDRNVAGKHTEHFFGSVTFVQNESAFGEPAKLILVDGQQRITTTMLFLLALRDVSDDEKFQNFIEKRYLRNENVQGNLEYTIKLKQVETDWQAYKNIVLKEKLDGNIKNSAVGRNYQTFYNKLLKYKNEGKDLSALIEKGLNKFSVITIQLEPTKNDWENPQEVFESMNSIGKPLSLADLVRNYLLMGQSANLQDTFYKKYWLPIEKVLPGQLSNYIRDYMQYKQRSSYKKASETNYKELYSKFKENFDGVETEQILEELLQFAELYANIISGVSSNKKIEYMLKDLKTIRITTAYSFLLALFIEQKKNNLTVEELENILAAFRIYCLRRRLIKLTTAENKNFPLLVRKIPQLLKEKDKKQAMFDILREQEASMRLPNDTELTQYLDSANFYNFEYCKFYLSLIEEKITKSRPDLSDQSLQIEHIMPQKLNDRWKEALGESYEAIHQELVHTIGNLTLIRHNQELGNKSFEEKKEFYGHKEGLQISKEFITVCKNWNERTIKERTKNLAEFLLQEVVPIPDEMRRSNNFADKGKKALSFQELGLIGETIEFIADPSIKAKVVSDKEVEFEGKTWRMSPLTNEIQTRRGTVNASGSYQGAQYWQYEDMKLADLL